jgi:uncharacterized membrane protein/sporulation protein YlmC with PRC-barrel domain
MGKIPLNAKVECMDGACGESITVIVNPTTHKVTHFVVKYEQLPDHDQRLVAVDQVLDTSSGLVRLRCTRDELAGMEPFLETQYIKTEQPVPTYEAYDSYMFPYVTQMETVDMAIEVERVPSGGLAVRRGTQVEASDGHVGEVGELVMDPSTGDITHLVLREGHLWGKKEITLPISAIDYVEEDTVVLKLDKEALEALPAIPVVRHYGEKRGTQTKQVELFVRVFDDTEKAGENLKDLKNVNLRGDVDIRSAAVLVKDQEGKVSITERGDVDAKHGALFGAITGGLIGLVGGPVGVVVGAAAGAATGGVAAKKIDMGLTDEFLDAFQERLKPGTSALVMVIEHDAAKSFTDAMADVGGMVLQETLTDEMVQQLLAESKSEGSEND